MGRKIKLVLSSWNEDTKEWDLYEIIEFVPVKNKDGCFSKATQKLLMEGIEWCLQGPNYKAEIISVN